MKYNFLGTPGLGGQPIIWPLHRMLQQATTVILRLVFATIGIAVFGAVSPAFSEETPSNDILPKPLSASDDQHYREVFKLQRIGKWAEAKKHFKRIEDKSLRSHVLYQKYMHPTKYRTKYPELNQWMTQYASHPGARQIYKLAQIRRPKASGIVPVPKLPKITGVLSEEKIIAGVNVQRVIARKRQSWRARNLARQVNKLVAKRKHNLALQLIAEEGNRKILGKYGLARARAAVARGFYHMQKNRPALELASKAAAQAPDGFGDAHWWAGLASWRLRKYNKASDFFAAIADDETQSVSLRTAAAFWAARSFLQSARPDKVNHYLTVAARSPRTFCGLLATQLLGYSPKFNWLTPVLQENDLKAMFKSQRLKRALALIQVGEQVRAEAEMKYIPLRGTKQENRILINIAVYGALPQLSYRLGHFLMDTNNQPFDAALYPLPAWTPRTGFKIDRALIYAVIRQESRFHSRARSSMGATGLMQLMPRTARFVASQKEWNGQRSALFDPVLNITLGQKYIRHLLNQNVVEGDLFYMIAAYNSGPGNLHRWQKKIDYGSDSLLFIESIPARETRIFVEQVLANYWIYRHRLNQPIPSLVTLATGGWPPYISLDSSFEEVAESAD
jgi:soluble lytic murein transglycosylase